MDKREIDRTIRNIQIQIGMEDSIYLSQNLAGHGGKKSVEG